MYKTISKSLLIALAITACPIAQASTPAAAKPTTGSAWTWTSYLAAGLAVVTPYLAYEGYKSYKAESAAKERDDKADALHYSKLIGRYIEGVYTPGFIAKREAISQEDRDAMVTIARQDQRSVSQRLICSSVTNYNSQRLTLKENENHLVELTVEDSLAHNNCGIVNTKFRLPHQKSITKAYGTLATITACSAAGLYFFGKK